MRRDAFTLLELTIVVMVLAIVATAMSFGSSGQSSAQKVELAAEQVATALRYARSEAVRTGEVHGAAVSHLTGKVQVFHADLSSGLSVPDYLLTNPFDKRPYEFLVGDLPAAGGARIANADYPFTYQGLGTAMPGVVFDAQGFAFWFIGGSRYQLATGTVVIGHGDVERKVDVARIGRVVVP